jgi:hypothetical protein
VRRNPRSRNRGQIPISAGRRCALAVPIESRSGSGRSGSNPDFVSRLSPSIGISKALSKACRGPGTRMERLRRHEASGSGAGALAWVGLSMPVTLHRGGSLPRPRGRACVVRPRAAMARTAAPAAPGVAARDVVYATAGATQAGRSCPASRARPRGGGCGSRPRWVRIFSIGGRSRMTDLTPFRM